MSKLKEKLMLSEKGYSDLKKSNYGLHNNQYRVIAPINGSLPDLLGAVKAVYGRSNFVGRVVEAAGPGAGGGYSGIPGREKRL